MAWEKESYTWMIGTSGFSYKHWKGVFYPKELPSSKWLAFYAEHFPCVEINATFYRQPQAQTLTRWKNQTPEGFCFILKAPKWLTHVKRLACSMEELNIFCLWRDYLEEKLGGILLQLPPSLAFSPSLWEAFFEHLPKNSPPLFWEGRHKSFGEEETHRWFREHNLSLVSPSSSRYVSFFTFTHPPAYFRFHGPEKLYASSYSLEELKDLVSWVHQNIPSGNTVFVFFNNDFHGYAVQNGLALQEWLSL